MATGFLGALSAASTANMNRRKADEVADLAGVSWRDAGIGIAILVVVQAAIVLLPFVGAPPESIPIIVDFSIMAFGMLLVPYLVLFVTAVIFKRQAQLPGVFLFLALILVVIQVVTLVLSYFGIDSFTPGVGILAYFSGRAAVNSLGLRWRGAVVVGLLVAVGEFAVSFLFLLLPTGQAMLAAA